MALNLPYDPKGFPDAVEELHIVRQACMDAFGPCGDEVPVELLESLHRLRACIVGRTHLVQMSNAAARVHGSDRRFASLTARISELERKRTMSGKHIADMHRKLAKLKIQGRAP